MLNISKNKIRILITGGTGFIGFYAVKYYVKQGYTVRVLVRKGHEQKLININGIQLAYGDMKDKKSLLEATKGVDWIINFAAAKSDEKDSYKINVEGVKNLLEGAKKNNVSAIIQISTISAKIKKLGIYGATKAAADRLLLDSTMPVTILRPSVVYGDLTSGIFGSLVKASNLPIIPIFGSGECFFYPIHVDDLIKATEIAAMNKKLRSKIYDIGGPDKVSLNVLVNTIAKNKGKRPAIIHIPAIFGIGIAKILSKIFYRAPITASNILGSTQNVSIDVQTFFKDFNFIPRSLQQGLSSLFIKIKKQNEEANLLFSYVLPKKIRSKLSDEDYDKYQRALEQHDINFYKSIPSYFSFILGPCDAFSKIFFPYSQLQKKLKIIIALVETSPYSAPWLLPKQYSFIEMGITFSTLFMITVIKFISGFILFLVPGLYKKYVI